MKRIRRVVLAGNDLDGWAGFSTGLVRDGEVVEIIKVDGAAAVLDIITSKAVDLVVVGEALVDGDPVACVTQLVRCNPMINCAMVSAMAADDFHTATEGLGVLMQLPPDPSCDMAAALLAKVESLAALLQRETDPGVRR